MPTDVAARRRSLRARHRCARCSRRGGRTRHAAALERSTPPSRRKLLRCYSLHGVVWRRVEISRGEGCRASSGFASHVPGVAQDDHLQQGALTGRHGARELSMRARGERGNGASARTTTTFSRAGGRAHRLLISTLASTLEPPTTREKVSKLPILLIGDARASSDASPSDASCRSSIPHAEVTPSRVFAPARERPPSQPWRRSSSSAAAAIRAP
jgi:hypothetical protein